MGSYLLGTIYQVDSIKCYQIYITQFDALTDYLKSLIKYYWSESDYILNNQVFLLSLTKDSIN